MREIVVLPTFQREAKILKKRYQSFVDDYEAFLDQIETNPLIGTDLGHGLRKVRMAIASKSKGKSGGARVITFLLKEQENTLSLLYIYDKADRSNISKKDLLNLLQQNGLQ
ncbi:MAG: type II toxin-antitoxin system RelE/ParE family toxin [Bacteroidaceae bacterium]|nr:type II toxin-antitoxin system RelE/ParE family toxin [Bacteroidaceae bacterium]